MNQTELFTLVNDLSAHKEKHPLALYVIQIDEESSPTEEILLEHIISMTEDLLDQIAMGSIVVPSKYANVKQMYLNDLEPFGFVDDANCYFFCTHTDKFYPSVVHELFKTMKDKYKLKLNVKFTWGFFKTFWKSYTEIDFYRCFEVLHNDNMNDENYYYIV